LNPTPEDGTNIGTRGGTAKTSSDAVNFALFMRLLAAPDNTTNSASEQNGAGLFNSTGCALCHSTTLTSSDSPFSSLAKVTYHPFSDFALHHMGSGLADGISQGLAGPDEFRTAPLWGLGQRLFFMHDGRTADLVQAIAAHSSSGSEANGVVTKYNAL